MQRLIPLINAGLVIILAYTLAQLTWLMWPTAVIAEKAPVITANRAAVPTMTMAAPQSIANLHLFGEPQASNAQVAEVPKVVPVTPLKLTLKGVIASNDPLNARAIIADQAGREDSYAINAQLPGEATLKEIFADHIVLNRNNQDEILMLAGDASTGGQANNALPANLPTALPGAEFMNPEFPEGSPPPDVAANLAAQAADSQAANISSSLRNYRDALATNPQSLAGVAQAEPVQEGGKFMGYRMQPGSDPALFSGLGLEPGDVVTAVNGITLDNPAKAFEIMQNLTTATQVQLVVNRNGQTKTLAAGINE
ncbi:MAG: type II secretion system protein GspC [Gammaproteobacteria bacterium]